MNCWDAAVTLIVTIGAWAVVDTICAAWRQVYDRHEECDCPAIHCRCAGECLTQEDTEEAVDGTGGVA